ncbi:MAG TPA: phage holin family protein [Hyphomicrobiaceae bacterium]|nr:phage holin family protein [Hyphomicrobiaceae bacterium]
MMAYVQSSQSLGDLVSGLVSDVSTLFRTEIELAKTEASEKFDDVMGAGRNLAIGGVLAVGAIGVFLAAIVSGLTALLVAWGMQPSLANFISAIVVTIVVGAIAWSMIAKGAADLRANKLNMERTARSLQQDAATVKGSL